MMYKERLALLFIGLVAGQGIHSQSVTSSEPLPKKAVITGQIVGAGNQNIRFGNQNKGGFQQPLGVYPTDKEGKFSFEYALPFPDYYFLQLENNQLINLILYGGDTVRIYADIKDVQRFINILGSAPSAAMNQFLGTHQGFTQVEDSLKRQLRLHPDKRAEVDAYFSGVAQQFYQERNTFLTEYGNTPAIVAALSSIDQKKEWKLYLQVVNSLKKSYASSPTVQNVAQQAEQLTKERNTMRFLEPGNEVKEIALPAVSGDTLRLSSLKGKVVLIDFWASWCRPCRMENPNVVRLYNHYKDHGFEVFSVSLDRDKSRWEAAIAQDGLLWLNHVSDLRGWSSSAAQLYRVRSIPFTVLIDREGKVIQTNLRGEALVNRLKTIFGH